MISEGSLSTREEEQVTENLFGEAVRQSSKKNRKFRKKAKEIQKEMKFIKKLRNRTPKADQRIS